jgi:phosphoenolpyruvate---glycerone phosphotransferase subunit DhaL
MMQMTPFIAVLGAVADEVEGAAGELNRLDGIAGDGDLGVTATQAAVALRALLPELEGLDEATVLRRCGSELARKAPSTCGTLVATGFLRAARAVPEVDAAAAGGPGAGALRLARLLGAAQTGIQERGKAAPGDRTLLDALDPAVAALRAAGEGGATAGTALQAAADAAGAGAEATRGMRARMGRAGWLAERAAGHVDAGAFLVALILRAAARATAGSAGG